MTEFVGQIDPYVRKARLYPALLVTLPIGVSVAWLWPGFGLEKIIPVLVCAGLPFFVANLVRSRGQRLEERLESRWGGMPTTQMLRLGEATNNPDMLRRRRRALQDLTGDPLPTRDDEQDNPRRSDQRYIAATRILITRVRDQRDHHPRLHEENINYGFWRNLLGLKPFALTSLVALLAIDGITLAAGREPQMVGVAAGLHVLCLIVWLVAVRPDRVLQQGRTYAERLFETLDHKSRAR